MNQKKGKSLPSNHPLNEDKGYSNVFHPLPRGEILSRYGPCVQNGTKGNGPPSSSEIILNGPPPSGIGGLTAFGVGQWDCRFSVTPRPRPFGVFSTAPPSSPLRSSALLLSHSTFLCGMWSRQG